MSRECVCHRLLIQLCSIFSSSSYKVREDRLTMHHVGMLSNTYNTLTNPGSPNLICTGTCMSMVWEESNRTESEAYNPEDVTTVNRSDGDTASSINLTDP